MKKVNNEADRILFMLLQLIEDEIPGGMPTMPELKEWTKEEKEEVGQWAAAEHIEASDGAVNKLHVPDVLKRRVK